MNEDEYWSHVTRGDDDACWEWTGNVEKNGYGRLSFRGKQTRSHRVALELSTGRAPQLHVLHSCDNRKCCNPRHLREGTQADNSRDMVVRGRSLRGERNALSVYNQEIADCVRDCYADGMTTREIAKHGIAQSTVWRIVSGKLWCTGASTDTTSEANAAGSSSAEPTK